MNLRFPKCLGELGYTAVDVTVRGVAVPMWASVVAAILFATLAGAVRREHRRAN